MNGSASPAPGQKLDVRKRCQCLISRIPRRDPLRQGTRAWCQQTSHSPSSSQTASALGPALVELGTSRARCCRGVRPGQDEPAGAGGDDQVVVLPFRAGGETLGGLFRSATSERSNGVVVEWDHASRPFVLGVAPRGAFVRGDKTFVDPQRLRLDVDVVPSQREHLAASQTEQGTEPQRHSPAVLIGVRLVDTPLILRCFTGVPIRQSRLVRPGGDDGNRTHDPLLAKQVL